MQNTLKKILEHPIFLTSSTLLISTFVSILLLIGRMVYTEVSTYGFLIWNLFLAWLPLVFAIILNFIPYKKKYFILSGLIFFIWLIFFPNAPYIVTDFIHLRIKRDMPLWYDIALLTSFSWNGLILGFYSLSIVQNYIRSHLGRKLAWIVVIVSIVMASFGIYLGRFLRWNSWDLFYNTGDVLYDVQSIFFNPFENLQSVGITIVFAVFLFSSYLTIKFFSKSDHVFKR